MYAVQVTNRLAEAVRAVCPVDGLSVGTVGDSGTVRLDVAAGATAEQTAAAQAVVAGFDWSPEAHAVWAVGRMRGDAGAAALADASGTGVANRAAESVGASRDNDSAEAFAALLDLVGVTPGQLAARIAERRQADPPPEGTATPESVADSATRRMYTLEVAGLMGQAIAAGYGDPLA